MVRVLPAIWAKDSNPREMQLRPSSQEQMEPLLLLQPQKRRKSRRMVALRLITKRVSQATTTRKKRVIRRKRMCKPLSQPLSERNQMDIQQSTRPLALLMKPLRKNRLPK